MNSLLKDIIAQLREIQDQKIWIGSNFSKMLDNLSEEEAFEIPHPLLHSIAEIISHLFVWREEAILKVTTGRGIMLDTDPKNWVPNEELKELGWSALKAKYDASLDKLISLIEKEDDSFLEKTYYDPDFSGDFSYRFVLEGMIHHDLYHLGQIGIVLKFIKAEGD
jgi:uncharacterized damage-inducible protein DinB